jgi:hypothetical protein
MNRERGVKGLAAFFPTSRVTRPEPGSAFYQALPCCPGTGARSAAGGGNTTSSRSASGLAAIMRSDGWRMRRALAGLAASWCAESLPLWRPGRRACAQCVALFPDRPCRVMSSILGLVFLTQLLGMRSLATAKFHSHSYAPLRFVGVSSEPRNGARSVGRLTEPLVEANW